MLRLAFLTSTSLFLIGCATTPDPAKVCTSEWIAPRAEKAVSRLESRTRSAIKPLKSVGESLAKGKTPGPFTMLRLSSSFERLEKELTEGSGIQDLKLLASTCDDPKIISKAMRDVFENQGISPKAFDFIENLGFYQNILRENLGGFESQDITES